METVDSFVARIDSVLGGERRKIADFRKEQTELYHDREQRLVRYEAEVRDLIPLIAPRLRALAERFKDVVKVQPVVRAHTRELLLEFRSSLARVRLKFGAFPDRDVRNIIFEYDLDIVPVFLKFDSQLTLQQPLEKVDRAAVIKWFDDRIVDFIKTYVSIYENDFYLQGQWVNDPIAGVSFPKHFAATTLKWQGETYFFISHETLDEFEKRHSIPPQEVKS